MQGRRPWLFVGTDPLAVAAVGVELAAAGWVVVDQAGGPRVGAARTGVAAVDVGRARATVVSRVDTDGVVEIIDLLSRSSSVVAHVPDHATAVDLWDQGRRLANSEWYDQHTRPLCDGLDEVQVALLQALVGGDTVEGAARRCHLSLRTAARRLAAARQALGARTNAEAALMIEHGLAQRRRAGGPPALDQSQLR